MTLCISDIREKRVVQYMVISGLCLIFALIYEYFSHGVTSHYMMCAFLIPLLGGFLVYLIIESAGFDMPGKWSANLYNSGIATLTVGSLVKGVLDIYGTTNHLIIVYLVMGMMCILVGIFLYIIECRRGRCA